MLVNPKAASVKHAAKLLKKRERLARGEFLVEGPQAVRELLMRGQNLIERVFVTTQTLESHVELVSLAAQANIEFTLASEEVLAVLSDTVTPQGIVAVAKSQQLDVASVLADSRLVTVLHEVRDPGNAGTVLRAADAAGADCVIFSGASIDPWHPKVVRSTTGSLFNVPVLRVTDFEDLIVDLRSANLTILAADVRGRDLDPRDPILGGKVAWIFGNEAHGLGENDRNLTDVSLKLPIFGSAESLNLASAASVCLYLTAFAQRG